MKYFFTFLIASLLFTSCADSVDRSNPEDVVRYYYQSKMDGTDNWKEVVPPIHKRLWKLKRALDQYEFLEFTKFEVKEVLDINEKHVYVKVYFEIKVKETGETDGGEDEVTLEKQNGKWEIIELPT